MRVLTSGLISIMLSAVAIVALAAVVSSNPITDSCSFQGRLSDASDIPVSDGPRDLTLSLWTDSTGGTMLYSEVRTVTTSKGLYSTCLGCGSQTFLDLMQSGDLWLQTQLAGQPPMVPRTRIRGVPRSVYASGVFGEATSGSSRARGIVSSKPGGVGGSASASSRVSCDIDNNGVDDLSAEMAATGDSANFHLSAQSPVGPSSTGTLSMNAAIGGVTMKAIQTKGTGAAGMVRMDASDSAGFTASYDATGPGGAESQTAQMTRPGGATFKAIQTKGTGAAGMVRMDANDSASMVSSYDVDGNGLADYAAGGSANDSSSRWGVTALAGDGGNHTDGWNVSTSKTETRETLKTYFENGDVPSQDQFVNASGSTFKAIQTKGTGAAGMVRMDANDSATVSASYDLDGNGVPETQTSQMTRPGQATFKAIQTKGTGASGMVRMDANDSATVSASYDLDGNGVPETETSQMSRPGQATFKAIQTKGTGASGMVRMDAGDSATVICQHDDNGNGHADAKANIAALLNGNVVIGCATDVNDDGSPDVSAEARTSVDSASFRLNALPPGAPAAQTISMSASSTGVHVAVGAATCDGTNWTNASDANLKENFRTIDGSELLDKIEALPVSEWNYKTQSDTVKHIGPTAQDFQRVFGVGSDGKTISTIDPSGIALAGIKELRKENNTLKAQNAALQKQLDELNKKVDRLLSH